LGYKRAAINALYGQMRERVRALPGVTSASLAMGMPFRWSYAVSLSVPGWDSLPSGTSGGPYVAAVTPEDLRALGTAARPGRSVGPAPGGDRPVRRVELRRLSAHPGDGHPDCARSRAARDPRARHGAGTACHGVGCGAWGCGCAGGGSCDRLAALRCHAA